MSHLIPHVSQPQYPVQARADVGLTFAANFLSPFAQDSVSKNIPVSSGLVVKPSPLGMGAYAPTTTTEGTKYPAGAIAAGNQYFTVIVSTSSISAESRPSKLFFCGDESGAPYAQHVFGVNYNFFNGADSGRVAALSYDNASVNGVETSEFEVDGKPHVYGWRNGTATGRAIWIDGNNRTLFTQNGDYALSAAYPMYVGSTNVASTAMSTISPILGVWVFNRMLSDAEMSLYTRNPWQLFQPAKSFNFKSIISGGNRRRRLLMAS